MASRTRFYLTAMVFMFLADKFTVDALDATDQCILTCDSCYKDQLLLDCANDCLFTEGNVRQPFKNLCPHFYAKEPSVIQVI